MKAFKRKTFEDIIGTRIGFVTVISLQGQDAQKRPDYNCVCSCGKAIIRNRYTLLHQDSSFSCGCQRSQRNSTQWTGYGEISGSFWHILKNRAKKRNLVFDVTIKQIWDLFQRQDRKCALSGVPLIFAPRDRQKTKRTASLDRIDSLKGYTLNNIQWVHKHINKIKGSLMDIEFQEWCSLVAKYKEEGLC